MDQLEELKAKMEPLHKLETDALRHFVRVCEENKLEYYVIGGTLLGAVRHKGFIPWDDDIDIAMPRDSYEKFLKIGSKCMPEHLLVESWHNKADYRSYFGKIRHRDIDIYDKLENENDKKRIGYMIDLIPLDGTPNQVFFRKIYGMKVLGYRFLCGAANSSTGILATRPKKERILLGFLRAIRLYRILDVRKLYRRMDRLFKRQNFRKSKISGTVMGAYKLKELVPTYYWGKYEEASEFEFEGIKVKGPKLWDEYLTHMYGNYMEIPPVTERRIHFQLVEKKEKQK